MSPYHFVHVSAIVGIPSALLFPQQDWEQQDWKELKVVFSGDAIGFSQDDLSSLRGQGFTEPQLQSLKAAKVVINLTHS